MHVHLLLMTLQSDGSTPLFAAAYKGHDAIVAALLSHPGVDVNKATVCTSCKSLSYAVISCGFALNNVLFCIIVIGLPRDAL